ncbi:hypothetical protein HZB89_01435 [archaeon]|nr:hypothetical protein [archaeon]
MSEHEQKEIEVNLKSVLLPVFLAAVLVLSIFQAVHLADIQSKFSSLGAGAECIQPVAAAEAPLSDYDKMMKEMHPDQFAASQAQKTSTASAASSQPAMVGGC